MFAADAAEIPQAVRGAALPLNTDESVYQRIAQGRMKKRPSRQDMGLPDIGWGDKGPVPGGIIACCADRGQGAEGLDPHDRCSGGS